MKTFFAIMVFIFSMVGGLCMAGASDASGFDAGGTVISRGSRIGDLVDDGWEWKGGEFEPRIGGRTGVVGSDRVFEKQGYTLQVEVLNVSDDPCSYTECMINSLSCTYTGRDEHRNSWFGLSRDEVKSRMSAGACSGNGDNITVRFPDGTFYEFLFDDAGVVRVRVDFGLI